MSQTATSTRTTTIQISPHIPRSPGFDPLQAPSGLAGIDSGATTVQTPQNSSIGTTDSSSASATSSLNEIPSSSISSVLSASNTPSQIPTPPHKSISAITIILPIVLCSFAAACILFFCRYRRRRQQRLYTASPDTIQPFLPPPISINDRTSTNLSFQSQPRYPTSISALKGLSFSNNSNRNVNSEPVMPYALSAPPPQQQIKPPAPCINNNATNATTASSSLPVSPPRINTTAFEQQLNALEQRIMQHVSEEIMASRNAPDTRHSLFMDSEPPPDYNSNIVEQDEQELTSVNESNTLVDTSSIQKD